MASPRRLERLNARLRADVAHVLQHELKDPRLGFCTVTRVKVARDLSTALVFVSVLGDEAARRRSIRALQDAAGHITGRVGRDLGTFQTPRLRFRLDESIAKQFAFEALLKEAVKDLPPAEAGEEPGEKAEG